MPHIEIRPPVLDDVDYIAAHMREADRREVWASSMATPAEALARSLDRSDMVWTGLMDGRPAAMFGTGPLTVLGSGASAWLLGTPEIAKIPRFFLTESRVYVDMMLKVHGTLMNFVDIRNRATLSWLGRLGAVFGEPQPYGMFGRPFVPFTMRQADV